MSELTPISIDVGVSLTDVTLVQVPAPVAVVTAMFHLSNLT